MTNIQAILRYEKKIDRLNGPCHNWLAGVNAWGYGTFGDNEKTYLAHRWGYIYYVGPISEKKILLHSCDNHLCQRLEHLRVGTDLENTRESFAKGRANRAKGSKVWTNKLTEEQVLHIRASTDSVRHLAEIFGVSKVNIYAIRNRETWRHLP